MTAAYSLPDFITACKNRLVRIWGEAEKDASTYFQLHDKNAIQDFIGNGGLENCCLDNSRPLEVWRRPQPAPLVDSYRFSSGTKVGYLAFYKSPEGKWLLKSFKMDMRNAPLNMPFADLARRLNAESEK